MKKILIGILTLSFLSLPIISLAQAIDTGPLTGCTVSAKAGTGLSFCSAGACTFATDVNCAICCLFSAIYTITDWIFAAVLLISSLLVIFGGFNIATAGGDPNKVNTGRNYILFAMIGFAVALFANAIPNIARALIGA